MELKLISIIRLTLISIKRNLMVLISMFLVITIFAISQFISEKTIYKSTLIANSEILKNEYNTLLFNTLNGLIKEKNHKKLSELLNLNLDICKDIVEIKSTSVDMSHYGNDEIKLTNTFKIEILVLNTKNLSSIQKAFIHYIQNNNFVKKKVELSEIYYKKLLIKAEQEIGIMDTIIINLTKQITNNKSQYIGDIAKNNTEIIDLYEKKLLLENSLSLLNEVLVIQDFIAYNNPVSPDVKIYIAVYSAIYLLCATLFILIRELISQL
ncbi:MAG: hypothetical protein NW207_08085 [Cytophagales bacterium]|nr:hypothetical protein [Cytophagales bacterium]